jgi:hypothetical protein
MRRSSLISAAMAFGMLAIAATTFAGPAKPRETWAAGQIARVDVSAKSVVVMQGAHEMTFALASDAQLMQGKKSLRPEDLSADVGRHVKVRYTTNAGTKLADRIDVSDAAPKAPAKAPAKVVKK